MTPSTQNDLNIQMMFDSLAPKYDMLNTLLSLGRHHSWNRSFVKMLGKADCLLDLCSGTGKVAYQYTQDHPHTPATLLDFSSKMLIEAKKRYPTAPFTLIEGDVMHLPLETESYTLASLAYGLRNLPNPLQGLHEIYRVLKPQGSLGILELTPPHHTHPLYRIHKLYLKQVVPQIGKWFSKHKQAYHYLSESIQNLPSDHYLECLFRNAKFRITQKKKLTFGAATIWILIK